MQPVTAAWLNERGDLHDARVSGVRTVGTSVEIMLDDEWASLRGLSESEGEEAPGTLVISNFIAIDGDLGAANGAWVSEVRLCGDELNLVFCDQPALTFRAPSAWWRSA